MNSRPRAGLQPEAVPHVLLVYPRIPDNTYWSYSRALPLISKKAILPPLGLATIAAEIPGSADFRLVDENVRPMSEQDLTWADVVMVSAMIVQDDSLRDVVARAREAGRLVIAGGPHPTTSYRELADIDCFVLGEAEPVIAQVWNDFLDGRLKRAYGTFMDQHLLAAAQEFFGENADLALAADRPRMEAVPAPRMDLIQMSAYKSMAVQVSRGCPVGCEFCDIWRRFGRRPRVRPVERVLAEMDQLKKLGWKRAVFVVDDNFIGDRRRCKEILRALADWQKKNGHPFDFYTEATLTLADDPELLTLFNQAGFDMVFIGIETPSVESLKETRKYINTSGSIADKVRTIQSHGIQVSAGFIIGFDSDPEDIAERMIEAVQQYGIPTAMVGLLQALPETDLHDRLQREGRLLAAASGNNTHDFCVNFRTRRPEADLVNDYRKVLATIYAPDLKSYFERCKVLRAMWKSPGVAPARLGWFEVNAVVRTVLTACSRRYRWNALGYLLSTVFTKPSFFPVALSNIIQGHHFREITRLAFEVGSMETYFGQHIAALVAVCQRALEKAPQPTWPSQEALRVGLEEHLKRVGVRARETYQQMREACENEAGDLRVALDGHIVGAGDRVRESYRRAVDACERVDPAALCAALEDARLALLRDSAERMRHLRKDARSMIEDRYDAFVIELDALIARLRSAQGTRTA